MSDISKATTTPRRIASGEAREIAQRLINSHFRQEPSARVGIPARPDYDDDLLIMAYIEQTARAHEALIKALREARAIVDDVRAEFGWPEYYATLDRIDAALALAEGKP